eukprot:9912154-Alexandrium_andersonii.AAC.1
MPELATHARAPPCRSSANPRWRSPPNAGAPSSNAGAPQPMLAPRAGLAALVPLRCGWGLRR